MAKKEKKQEINRDYEFFKIQVYSDKTHTLLAIGVSIAFVLFSLVSIFYGLYFEGFFGAKPAMMETGYWGIVIIIIAVIIVFGDIVRVYTDTATRISDMIEAVNEGKALPTLDELPKWKKDETE